jgi:hypothetical protein
VLPLELGGETLAGPAGIGVGLEEAEVTGGGFAEVFEGLEAVEGVDAPAGFGVVVALPVERRLPAFGAHGGPAFGEPELGAVVTVLVDEGEVLSTGYGTVCELEGRDVNLVARGLVVEGEGVGGGWIESEANLGEAWGEADPFDWGGDDGLGLEGTRGGKIAGVERVGEESVLDVGGDEFLVLLLVFEAEDDALDGVAFYCFLQEAGHAGVDVPAIGEDGFERGAREGCAEFLFGHVPEGVVVAVEEPAEVGMEGLIAGEELAENKGFEEPAGVGEVPFDGAGLGRRLDHHVFRREGSTEMLCGLTHGLIAREEGRGGGLGGDGHRGLLLSNLLLMGWAGGGFCCFFRLGAMQMATCVVR